MITRNVVYFSLLLVLFLGGCVQQTTVIAPGQNATANETPIGTLPLDYCDQDCDCVRQANCCDCGDGAWVNKANYDPSLCPTDAVRCMCASRERYPLCSNHRCTSTGLIA